MSEEEHFTTLITLQKLETPFIHHRKSDKIAISEEIPSKQKERSRERSGKSGVGAKWALLAFILEDPTAPQSAATYLRSEI